MGGEKIGQWLHLLVSLLILIRTEEAKVPITIVKTAKAKGAVCLDGSPPAYHFDEGSGSGINNWLVFLEGGGWCENVRSCRSRSDTFRGSSTKMDKSKDFSGILGREQTANPDFYNWNRIRIRYCDGSSFTGDVEAVDPKTNLYYRGERVWQAIIDELLAKGMRSAQNAILSGCSAGGLAAILHCDKFSSLLPASARVKCVSDAGFFVHGKDISGGSYIESYYGKVVSTHGSAKNLPASCTSRMRPELCFFPQYVAQTMRTPLFLINAAYDSWQIKYILAPSAVDKNGSWNSCKIDLKKCSNTQMQTVQNFREQFVDALTSGLGSSSSCGYFIDSCYAHCQSASVTTWLSDQSPMVANTKIGKAVGDWFYDRVVFQKIDCAYPCNPTCVNVVLGE